jgi:hypothetical protein
MVVLRDPLQYIDFGDPFLVRMRHDDTIKSYGVILIDVPARPTASIRPHNFLPAQPSINQLTTL